MAGSSLLLSFLAEQRAGPGSSRSVTGVLIAIPGNPNGFICKLNPAPLGPDEPMSRAMTMLVQSAVTIFFK